MGPAQVQFMITNAMRATLVDELDYTDEEVSAMRPEIAAQLIKARTKRPFGDRPMPEAWKRGGPIERRSGGGLFSNNLVRLAVAAIFGLVGAVATGVQVRHEAGLPERAHSPRLRDQCPSAISTCSRARSN